MRVLLYLFLRPPWGRCTDEEFLLLTCRVLVEHRQLKSPHCKVSTNCATQVSQRQRSTKCERNSDQLTEIGSTKEVPLSPYTIMSTRCVSDSGPV